MSNHATRANSGMAQGLLFRVVPGIGSLATLAADFARRLACMACAADWHCSSVRRFAAPRDTWRLRFSFFDLIPFAPLSLTQRASGVGLRLVGVSADTASAVAGIPGGARIGSPCFAQGDSDCLFFHVVRIAYRFAVQATFNWYPLRFAISTS